MPPTRTRALFVLLLAIFGVGSASIMVRYTSSPPLVTAFWRVFIAGVIAIGISAFKENTSFPMLKQELWKITLAGIALALHFWLWFMSLFHIPVAINIVLVDSTPIWLALASYFFLHISLTKRELFGISLAIGGILLFSLQSGEIKPLKGGIVALGIFLALISSWVITINLLIGRNVLKRIGLWMYFGVVNLVAASTLLGISLFLQTSLVPTTSLDLILFILLAFGPSLIGHAGFNYAIQTLKPSTVGLGILGEVVIASLLAFIFFHEVPSTIVLVGGFLIISGTVLTILEEAKKSIK